jgi:hypothetical protein
MSLLKEELDKIWNRPGVSRPLKKAWWRMVTTSFGIDIIPRNSPIPKGVKVFKKRPKQ